VRRRSALLPLAALVAVVGVLVGTAPATSAQKAEADIVSTAIAAGQFETLTTLVKQAGLARTLRGKGPFTVFAPTDAAFRKVPRSTLRSLARNRAQLRAVLLYHVAQGKVTSKRVVKLDEVETLNGATAAIRVRGGRVFVGGARVVTPDVMASNGVIHVVDKVLLPPS
jgi:uncharacterized surface protein with fasciclin (FAS1) repeats